ncbi:hypothetical protein A2U01_0024275, partial [Trifolium medium]|nr:hypothetical protein [Trifolium medium]
ADPSDTGSDPIQSSDAGEVHSVATPNRSTRCGHEVVLPFQIHGDRSLPPSIPRVGSSMLGGCSGVGVLTNGGGFIEEEWLSEKGTNNQSTDDPRLVREVEEAKKLIKIGEEVGLRFHDGEGEDVARMVELEVRDCAEVDGWVKMRGYQ